MVDATELVIADLIALYGPPSGDPAIALAISELHDPALNPKPDDLAQALRIRSGEVIVTDDVTQYLSLLRRIRESRV